VGATGVAGDAVADWQLEPTRPDWAADMLATWVRGEAGAQQDLEFFLTRGLKGYAAQRDRPDLPHTSRLSPRLRFGELSPHQVWHACAHAAAAGKAADADVEKLLSELGWREFCYHLLNQQPALATVNFNRRFDGFPWRADAAALAAWQGGRTGYPLVDAGMRQLWATGWMHNRVRMVTASFLIKHLLIDWRAGEQWFWDTLVDADVASNPANWQWVAGSGADAAPYFRIFNPVLQSEKFDPSGGYIRRFVPELGELDAHSIHAPDRAPPLDLSSAGVTLGKTYPAPIVAHEDGRRRALAALATIKSTER
jgi:deoxyribodipyrimidine photo-lyase